jgi:hypothetical protein
VTTAPLAICSACGASAVVDGVCGRCGTPSGESNRCPHCNAIARVEPKGEGAKLTWVCGVCAGPRMPNGAGGAAAAVPLREAKSSLTLATRLRISYRLFAFAASLSMLALVAGVLGGAHMFIVFVAIATAFQATMALRQRSRAQHATADANEALDRAWLAAAEDVASHAKKGVTVAELASRLLIDAVKAEKLLTELAVHDRTRIDVDDDAEVRYSVSPDIDVSAPDRVRVDATEEQFRALEEAELDEAEAKKLATPAFPRGSR